MTPSERKNSVIAVLTKEVRAPHAFQVVLFVALAYGLIYGWVTDPRQMAFYTSIAIAVVVVLAVYKGSSPEATGEDTTQPRESLWERKRIYSLWFFLVVCAWLLVVGWQATTLLVAVL